MVAPHPVPTCSSESDEGSEDPFQHLGWCPHQVRRLQLKCKPRTLDYLSTVDRRGYRPNNHCRCRNYSGCIANNVNTEVYSTRHTETCSGSCSLLSVDYNHVVDIIRAGGVPIISIHGDAASTGEEPNLHLRVTPRAVSTRYTVISHVWFDGLGNPSANALPTCQIQRLFVQLQSLPPDSESGVFSIGSLQVDWTRQSFVRCPERQAPMFWMDTLCIPVQSEHEHLRMKAIAQMASIYSTAVQELVLDAELMQCEVEACPALETIARVACSAWMTRSWTLQEGVLARECVFQFKDCAIDPIHEWCLHGPRPTMRSRAPSVSFPLHNDEEQWAVYRELYEFLWDTLHQDWKSTYRKDPPTSSAYRASDGKWSNLGGLRAGHAAGKIMTLPAAQGISERGRDGLDRMDHFTMQLREEHRIKQFIDTWNELAHRSTTKSEDLHVIIANLLDFNADRIMDIPTPEERMRAMILSFDSLPVSLFWNTGSKWRDNWSTGRSRNNRWIPVEPSKSELSMTPVMKVTDEWLTLSLGTKTIQTRQSMRVLFLRDIGINILEHSSLLCSSPLHPAYNITLFHAAGSEDISDDPRLRDEGPHYLITETSAMHTASPMKGALFRGLPSHPSDGDHVLRLSYRCPVSLQVLERDLSPEDQHATYEVLPSKTNIKVKYDRIPNFTSHQRRLNRGPSLQGGVAIMILLPIAVSIGVICMICFIAIMARPPHTFTPVAKGLLAAFIVLYVVCPLVGAAWLLFIEAFMYRMWLESFESDWVAGGEASWWGRLVRLERFLGRAEHAAYELVRRVMPRSGERGEGCPRD